MNALAVAFGGALGALLRYGLAVSLATHAGKFPYATFCANVVGSFLMGLGFVLIVEKHLLVDPWRHFLLIGCLGAFTTFSTFSIEVLSLWEYHSWKFAIFYALLSCFAAIAAVFSGLHLAKTFFS